MRRADLQFLRSSPRSRESSFRSMSTQPTGSSVGQRDRRVPLIRLTIAGSARTQASWASSRMYLCMLDEFRRDFAAKLGRGPDGVSGSNHVFYSSVDLAYLGNRVKPPPIRRRAGGTSLFLRSGILNSMRFG